MKKETKQNILLVVILYAILLIGVILMNNRIEQSKIDTEVSIIENR